MVRAQVFSFDAIIAAVVFVVIVATVLTITSHYGDSEEEALRERSQYIANRVTSEGDPLSIIDPVTKEIDPVKLDKLVEKDYQTLKNDLGINEDFCILIVDETGSIILVGNTTTGERVGIGQQNLTFNISGKLRHCSDIYKP